MAKKKIPTDTRTFHYYNANPKDKYTSDCVIRALMVFLDKEWDEVLTELTQVALKWKLMPNDTSCYEKYLKSLGYEKRSQPKKSDGKKLTGKEFCERLHKGGIRHHRYLAHIGGHHMVCIKGNQVYDTWDSTDGCIGNYWVRADV